MEEADDVRTAHVRKEVQLTRLEKGMIMCNRLQRPKEVAWSIFIRAQTREKRILEAVLSEYGHVGTPTSCFLPLSDPLEPTHHLKAEYARFSLPQGDILEVKMRDCRRPLSVALRHCGGCQI